MTIIDFEGVAVEKRPKTLGELKASGYIGYSVKDELRKNLIRKIETGENIFPGIIGYEKTVIPALQNALLSKHDFILIGLRGQAKTRILRSLPKLLDDFIPVIAGSEINDHPLHPISKYAVDLVAEKGTNTPITWLSRELRFNEKLATPDVTIADLLGDIDPIKAAVNRLHFAHEGIIHFGLIPRTNRGIFIINELPDLPPRIQVGLLNVMQERDIQIRGFPISLPLDILIVYSANPEDYTNRGNIITPLRDRIGSQIHTHYPRTIEDGMRITDQESFIQRKDGQKAVIPHFFKEIIEHMASQARESEFVNQKSGVSARMTITSLENLISNAERRALKHKSPVFYPRICDLLLMVPSITGKIELVYEGEQEGPVKVAKALIGRAVKMVFRKYFPDAIRVRGGKQGNDPYREIRDWFSKGNTIEIEDDMPQDEYFKNLSRIPGLYRIAKQYLPDKELGDNDAIVSVMEFVLDGLHQNSVLSKDELDTKVAYKDMVESLFNVINREPD